MQVKGGLDYPSLATVRSHFKPDEARLPEYEQQIVTMERLESQKAATLGTDLPSVQLVGDFGRNAYTSADMEDPNSTYWSAGVQLTIPLFTGLSSVYTRRDFASQASQLELARNGIENNLAFAQVKSLKNVEVSYASIIPSVSAYQLAQASLKEAEKMIRLGTINYLQFLSVQQALYQAETALNQAKFNYISNLVNYFVATGMPLDRLIDELQGRKKG